MMGTICIQHLFLNAIDSFVLLYRVYLESYDLQDILILRYHVYRHFTHVTIYSVTAPLMCPLNSRHGYQ
jgi:hypothetical protein